MSVREVLQLGHPDLRKKCKPVDLAYDAAAKTLAEDLQDTLAHWQKTTGYGRGIAAPQIGELKRMVFLNVDKPWPLVNPEIIDHSENMMTVWDSCLSFLTFFMQVKRYEWITVRYQDLAGKWHEVKAEGDLAELLQHELDHLDGVLAVDHIFDSKMMCSKQEFEKRYKTKARMPKLDHKKGTMVIA